MKNLYQRKYILNIRIHNITANAAVAQLGRAPGEPFLSFAKRKKTLGKRKKNKYSTFAIIILQQYAAVAQLGRALG